MKVPIIEIGYLMRARPEGDANTRAEVIFVVEAIAGCILLCGLIAVIAWRGALWSIAADESGRLYEGYKWLANPSIESLVGAWLPLQTIIDMSVFRLLPNLMLVSRLVSNIFGATAAASVVTLSWILFRSRPVTVLTALLTALFADRIILSSVGLIETQYFAAIALATLCFGAFVRRPRPALVLLGAICLVAGEATRYEAWVFTFFAGIWLTWLMVRRRLPVWCWIAAGLIVVAFPIAWLGLQRAVTGDAMHSFVFVTLRFKALFGTSLLIRVYAMPLTQFVLHGLVAVTGLGAVYAVALAVTHERLRLYVAWVLGPLLLLSLTNFISFGYPTGDFWRTASLYPLLLMPFTAAAVWQLGQALGSLWGGRAVVLAVALAACLSEVSGTVDALIQAKPAEHFSRLDRDTGRWAAAHLLVHPPGTPVIDTTGWAYLNVLIASNRPDAFALDTGPDITERAPSRIAQILADASGPTPPLVVQDNGLVARIQASGRYHEVYSATARDGVGWHVYEPLDTSHS